MPQIPGVPDLQPVDKPSYINPRQAGKPGQAISQLADTSVDIAVTGLDLEAHIREAQKHVDVIAAQNHMKALDDELQIELKKTTNSSQIKDVLDQYTGPNGKLHQVVKDFGKSPVAIEIQMSAQGLKPSMDTLGQARQLTLLGQENDANTAIQIKTLLPQLVAAHRSGDVSQENQIRSHVESLYDDAVKNGLMTTADKQLNMDAFQEATQKQINEAAITSANPTERQQAIAQLGGGTQGAPPSTSGYSTLVELGKNFQWYNRPEVDTGSIKKGTTGTVYSASRDEDGVEVLFPTIYDGKLHSEDEAWQHYKDTGQFMAKFAGDEKQRIADADAFGQKYHEDAEAGKYGRFGQHSATGPLDLTNLAAGDVSALNMHAQEVNERMNNLAESQNLNAKLNTVDSAFQAPEFKGNFEAQQNALQDGDWLKQHGIVTPDGTPDRVMAEKISSEVERERTFRNQEQSDNDEKIVEKYSPLIDENKMSRPQIDALPDEAHGGISNRARSLMIRQWTENARINRQMALQDRQEARQEQEDRSGSIMGNYLIDIASGKIVDPVDVSTTPGLMGRDKPQILSAINEAKNHKDYQAGMDILLRHFDIKGAAPEQADRLSEEYTETYKAWVEQVNANPTKDKSVIAQEVLRPKIQKQISDLLDQRFGVPPTPPLSLLPAYIWEGIKSGATGGRYTPRYPSANPPSGTTDTTLPSASKANAPPVGTVKHYDNADWKFKGGDQYDQTNWEKQP
jgi:soluble cytochrome b562